MGGAGGRGEERAPAVIALLRAEWRNWAAGVRAAGRADRWRAALFLALLAAFVVAAEYLSFRLFTALVAAGGVTVELIALLLVMRLLGLVFLVVATLLFFGAMIAAIDAFYFAEDIDFLASHPVRRPVILAKKLVATWLVSAWVVFLVVMPLMAGYGRAVGHGYAHLPLAALALALYTVPPVALASTLVIALVRFLPVDRAREAVLVAGAALSCGVIYLYRLLSPARLFAPKLLLGDFRRFVADFTLPMTPLLPTHRMTEALMAGARGDGASWAAAMGSLALAAAGALAIFFALGGALFATDRPVSADAAAPGPIERLLRTAPLSRRLARLAPRGARALVYKEIMTNLRDPMQISHVFLIGGIVLLHFLNLSEVPYDLHPAARTLVAFLNLALVGFLAAAVAVRFVYPSVSLEGRPFWLMETAPLLPRHFVLIKFLAGWLPLAGAAVVTVAVSNHLVGVSSGLALLWIGATLAVSTVITAFGIALGLALPAFDRRNVFEISSSSGGIVFMMLSLLYVMLVIVMLARPTSAAAFGRPLGEDARALAAAVAIGASAALLTGLSLRAAVKSFASLAERRLIAA